MKKVILFFLLAVAAINVYCQDDYSFINKDNQVAGIKNKMYSVDSTAVLYFEGSWCYVILKYEIDKDKVVHDKSATVINGTKYDADNFELHWSVYKDKKLFKDGSLYYCVFLNNFTEIKFRYSGMLAPTKNFSFKTSVKKGDLLVLDIPKKDIGIKKEIFKITGLATY